MSAAGVTSQPVVSPLSKNEAAANVQPIFDKLTQALGRVPSFYATMARVPDALERFMPLYSAVMNKGTVEAKYKELAYLKTALINASEHCFKPHSPSRKKNAFPPNHIKPYAF